MSALCLSAAEIAAFLAGELSGEADARIEDHLQGCAACRQQAHELSDDPAARRLLAHQRSGSGAPLRGDSLGELKGRLAALALFEQGSLRWRAGSTDSTFGGDDTEPADHAPGMAAPRRLGKFTIERPLGAGGFGVVYLARDTVLDRKVALKLPRSSVLADPDLRRRLAREAAALARLDHPGIVPVYEAGEADGTCYIAVGYCQGPTLERWLAERKRPLDPRQAARLALALAEAVEHAHAQGILHRDIKPSNVLLDGPLGNQEQPAVKLADFGLAKLIDDSEHAATMSGMLLGTPQYMAPEQAAGMAERIGPATDVYALGAVLYELLTGRPPIQGRNSADTLRRVLVDDPERPQRLALGVPADLDAIVMKCLEKSATRRYATAAALADDLRQFLAARPTQARPLRLGERSLRWARRNPAAMVMGGLACLLAVMASGLLVMDQSRRASLKQAQLSDQQIAAVAYASEVSAAADAVRAKDIAQGTDIIKRHIAQQNIRGLESYYLEALITRKIAAQVDVRTEIYQIAVSHNGGLIAAACKDGFLRVYRSDSLSLVRESQSECGELNGVEFSAQDSQVVVAGDSGHVRTLELASGTWQPRVKVCQKQTYCAIPVKDGFLATCGNEPDIGLWRDGGRSLANRLRYHVSAVEAIRVSPDGKLLAAGGEDGAGSLWDLQSGALVRSLKRHTHTIAGMAFSPEGSRLATAGHDNEVVVWDVAVGRAIFSAIHSDPVQAVAYLDGSTIVSADRKGTIYTWNVPAHNSDGGVDLLVARDVWHGHDGIVRSVAHLPDRSVVSAGGDGTIRRWQGNDRQGAAPQLTADGKYFWAALDAGGDRLYAARRGSRIVSLDANSPGARRLLSGPALEWDSLVFLNDKNQFAAGTTTGELLTCENDSGRVIRRWRVSQEPLDLLSYIGDKSLLAFPIRGEDVVVLFDLETGTRAASLPAEDARRQAVSPGGEEIAVNTGNGIAVYDLRTFTQVRHWPAHADTINWLAYHPNGKLLASASEDRSVKIWRADGQLVTTLSGHRSAVNCLAFTPDGKTLISADHAGTIRATNVMTFKDMMQIDSETNCVRKVIAFPDNRRLAIIDAQWNLRIIGEAAVKP